MAAHRHRYLRAPLPGNLTPTKLVQVHNEDTSSGSIRTTLIMYAYSSFPESGSVFPERAMREQHKATVESESPTHTCLKFIRV